MTSAYLVPSIEYSPRSLLAAWGWFLPTGMQLLSVSEFGHLFLVAPTGAISCLDIIRAELIQVSSSQHEFELALKTREFQVDWLLADLIDSLQERGMRRSPRECFAFRTPPILGGTLQAQNIVPWNLETYHVGLSSLFRQVLDLPVGTEIVIKPPTADA